MPTYKNVTNTAFRFGGVEFKPGQTAPVFEFASPDMESHLILVSQAPTVDGPIGSAELVADSVYNIPFVPGDIVVYIIADTSCSYSFGDGGIIMSLAQGTIYETPITKRGRLGKVSITGSAWVVVERR